MTPLDLVAWTLAAVVVVVGAAVIAVAALLLAGVVIGAVRSVRVHSRKSQTEIEK